MRQSTVNATRSTITSAVPRMVTGLVTAFGLCVLTGAVPATAAPHVRSIPAAPTPSYKNSLVVTVSGYGNAKPFIGIQGPKQNSASMAPYFRMVHASTTLKSLTPGRYTISAEPVTLSTGRYVPSKSTGTVTLKATGSVKYAIRYTKAAGSNGSSDGNSGSGSSGNTGGGSTKVTAVTGLVVEPAVGKLSVHWDSVFGATGVTHTVTATANGDTTPSGVCTVSRSSATCSALLDSKNYVVTVVSKDQTGQSATATAAAVTPLKPNQTYINGVVLGPGENIGGRNLAGARLMNASLRGATAANTDFTGADLTGADLTGADLTGAKLKATTLKNVKSGGLIGTPASLPDKWRLINGYLVGPGANLTDARFEPAADFAGTSLSGTTLTGATIRNATFSGVDFSGASLRNVDATGADFRGTRAGTLAGLTLDGGTYSGAHLQGVNLTGASLKSAKFTGTYLVDTNLTQVVATGASFSGADLTNANTTKADFTYADFKLATLSDADFTSAILTSVTSGSVTGDPKTLPAGWGVRSGYLIGAGASLSAAKLIGADLSGLDLRGATVTSANLTGANLTNVNLSSANLSGATLVGANLTNVTAVAANFSNASIKDATVEAADFTSATLTNLTATNLTGTPKTIPNGWKFDSASRSIVKAT